MTMNISRLSLLLSCLLPLVGCGDSAEARELRDRAGQTFDAGADWAAASWDDFKVDAGERLDQLETALQRLEEATRDERGAVSEAMRQRLDQLRAEVRSMRDSYDKLGSTPGERWQEIASRLGAAAGEVQHGMAEAWEQLGEPGGGAAAESTGADTAVDPADATGPNHGGR